MMFAPGRDGVARAVGVEAVAGDDAGDVRAVAPVVVRLRVAVDEVDEVRHALTLAIGDRQVVVPAVMPESTIATPTPAPL